MQTTGSNTVPYNGPDPCEAQQRCLLYFVHSTQPGSFEVYRTSSTSNWQCLGFVAKNKDPSVFNAYTPGAVAYGFSL